MPRGGYSKPWEQADIDTLVEMYNNGASNREIAKALDKSESSVKSMLSKTRKVLNLPLRIPKGRPGQRQTREPSAFDIAWQGKVPFGHWLITKPWPYMPEQKEDVA